MQPSSPPPYTPVPMEGHVTLMHSGNSPPKRQSSLEASFHASELEVAAAEPACSFRSTGGTSVHGQGGVNQERAGVADLNCSHTSAEVMELLLSSTPRRSSRAGDEPVTRGQEDMQNDSPMTAPALPNAIPSFAGELRPGALGNGHFSSLPEATSSQLFRQESCPFPSLPSSQTEPSEDLAFPHARPPSPFPQSRPISRASPPPLALLRPLGTHRMMPTAQDFSEYDRMPFRLPPLQQQQQRESTHRKHRRKKRHTWHGQPVTGLGSIPEHVTIVE